MVMGELNESLVELEQWAMVTASKIVRDEVKFWQETLLKKNNPR